MFAGRLNEQKQLSEHLNSAQNELVVLYGREGVGKTALIRHILQSQQREHYLYYLSQENDRREQLCLLSSQFHVRERYETLDLLGACGLAEVLLLAVEEFLQEYPDQMPILIIDEFRWMCEADTEFGFAVASLLSQYKREGGLKIILLTSSVCWAEDRMIGAIGELAGQITGLIKLKELSFLETVSMFPSLTIEDSIVIYALFGGIPKYLVLWDVKLSRKANLLRMLLSSNGLLCQEAQYILRGELRELPAYNAILACMAQGKYKLNDIYGQTGYGRAKISVYIKNLTRMDLVEKVFSFDTCQSANTQKGLYRVKDHFLNTWYRFCYPNASLLANGEAESIYTQMVLASETYMRRYFGEICREFLQLLNRHGKLTHRYTNFGAWYGKKGQLDIVAGNETGEFLVARCFWSRAPVGEEEADETLVLSQQAGILPSQLFLFSKSGFTVALRLQAKKQEINLIELKDL